MLSKYSKNRYNWLNIILEKKTKKFLSLFQKNEKKRIF